MLAALGNGQTAPKLVAQQGDIVVQEAITGQRLPIVLEASSEVQRTDLLIAAGASLLSLQQQAQDAGLVERVPKIGSRPNWSFDFASAPRRLSEQIEIECPAYDVEDFAQKIAVQHRSFVKWDARPGNAILTPKRTVSWFDWEHCGVGSVEDDLVWLLADEWSPISFEAEQQLLSKAERQSPYALDELTDRFRRKAFLHSVVRLSLIFDRKANGPWWNVRSAMDLDQIGVSIPHVQRLCRRMSFWANSSSDIDAFSDWIPKLLSAFENLKDTP